MLDALARLGVATPNRSGLPIIEIPLRDHTRIADVGRFLFDQGVYVTLAAYPLVPKDEVGFRVQLTAANTDAEVDRLIRALEALDGARRAARRRRRRSARRRRMSAARRTSRAGVAGSAWLVYLGVGALLCLLYVTVPPFRGSGPVMNLLGLSPVVAILAGVRMHRPASPGPWRWFAVGFALFWFGDLYTYSYPLLLDGDVPFPSLGDGAYLLVYPALITGLVLLVRRRRSRADRSRAHRRADPHRRPRRCPPGSR